MYLLINLKTEEIERTETNWFHFDRKKYKLIDKPFSDYMGKRYFKNNKIVKQ